MKNKIRIAWGILIILLSILAYISYVRFFSYYDYEIEETNESSSDATNIALTAIVDNFNNSEDIINYKNEGININAVLNQHSIYISFIEDITTTYEFKYNNLMLNINIENTEENLTKFNILYKNLIKSIQKRLNNNDDKLDELINLHINDNMNLVGLEKKINEDNTITYRIDITKIIEEGE